VDRELFLNARRIGAGPMARKLVDHTWHTTLNLVLRCDLTTMAEPRPAKIDVDMIATESITFGGFRRELESTHGSDFLEAYVRDRMCADGVMTLYVASSAGGAPIYAQWLIGPGEQAVLDKHAPGRYQRLADDEFFVDAAYTFVAHRGKGAMGDGMAQLLRIARDRGARWVITFVSPQNVPSLRGCAGLGFELDSRRLDIRRLGRRTYAVRPLDDLARTSWETAVAPHSSA
jgi:hypothetical protein